MQGLVGHGDKKTCSVNNRSWQTLGKVNYNMIGECFIRHLEIRRGELINNFKDIFKRTNIIVYLS